MCTESEKLGKDRAATLKLDKSSANTMGTIGILKDLLNSIVPKTRVTGGVEETLIQRDEE